MSQRWRVGRQEPAGLVGQVEQDGIAVEHDGLARHTCLFQEQRHVHGVRGEGKAAFHH
jgi:hypothetical protein